MAVISTQALTKRYPGVNALDELTIDVKGGIVGLVGANGAGKSTLVKLLLGLIAPTSGDASILDFNVRTQGSELRQFVGYMPEHDCLPLDMNATEFVAHMAQISGLPRTAARERAAETLRHAGLFEERYRAMAGYSTGMRQRAKLAQALVHDPRIVFLDEPTNGLDPAGRDEMLDLIRRTGTGFGINIVMATHLLGEIERVCDHLIVLDAGRLVHHGPLAGFMEATQTLDVEVTAGAGALGDRLRAHAIDLVVDGQHVLVRTDHGQPPFDLIRDSAAELGLGLVRMEQQRRTLEDLFRVQAAVETTEVEAAGV